jgi:glycosyltransferase involved in cell wall biosynthesis
LRAAIEKCPETKLLLVGNDQEGTAQDVKAKVKALGLQDRVIFTGLRGDVPEVLQAMDVFVFPSFFEGLPVSILEAQASGLPCLMSEEVTLESKLTEAVEQLSLDLGPAYWAEKAIDSARDFVRTDTGKQIVAAGYDIKANAKRLQDYYIACAQGKAIRFEDVSKSP